MNFQTRKKSPNEKNRDDLDDTMHYENMFPLFPREISFFSASIFVYQLYEYQNKEEICVHFLMPLLQNSFSYLTICFWTFSKWDLYHWSLLIHTPSNNNIHMCITHWIQCAYVSVYMLYTAFKWFTRMLIVISVWFYFLSPFGCIDFKAERERERKLRWRNKTMYTYIAVLRSSNTNEHDEKQRDTYALTTSR